MSPKQSQRAMEAALAIPELLESILSHLDMTTLLVSASRVSKTWKMLMDESPAIQQVLFFKPVPAQSPVSRVEDEPSQDEGDENGGPSARPVINPLLADKFDKCFFDFGSTCSFHRRANSFYELPWSPNPVQTTQETWGGWSQLRPPTLDAEAVHLEEECRRRFTRRGASWRRMLVSQPPPPSLGCMRFDISDLPVDGQNVWSAEAAPSSAGLRMGELYDVVQHHAGHHGRHSLWFRVLWDEPVSGFAITPVKKTFERLMARTGVVVEFMHADDTSLPNHPQDPADEGAFDAAFRCEEYREVKFKTEEAVAYPSEFPMFDGRYVVWHWRLFDHERASN